MIIGTIVEGPTDRLLLKAIIDKISPEVPIYRDLQPLDIGASFGQRGTGWKGVRQFCRVDIQQRFQSINDFVTDYQLDMLVIHIDADIATEQDLQDGFNDLIQDIQQPCPPILPTTNKLREVIARWLNLNQPELLPPQVVLVIPAQDSENWVFAGLFPDDLLCQSPGYECIHPKNSPKHPTYLLTLPKYRKILNRTSGTIKKHVGNYLPLLPEVIQNWNRVCDICTQAQAFHNELVARL